MNLLLINSNDKDAFAALYQNGELCISKTSEFFDNNPGSKKPDKLIHTLHKISEQHNICDIDAICVTIGPGSFTGIRVGLSLAKGMAFGLDKKIIPVNNFHLTLNRASKISAGTKYCVLIPAKVPEYYYSVIKDGNQIKTGCTEILDLDKILEKDTIIAGDFDDETSIKHPYFEVINVKNLKNEPDSMLELAQSAFEKDQLVNPEDIEPVYIKDFIIKSKSK